MNEFNYEGWIGSIVGTYSSTSEFPIEGTPNAIYLVVDSGTAEAYVWDETGNDYIQMSGGGGGGTDTNAVHYRGTAAQASDLPATPSKGDLYEATAAFTLGSDNIEAGDFLIYDSSNWKVIQGNLNGAVSGPNSSVDGHLAVFDGTSGKLLKDGGALPDIWDVQFKDENIGSDRKLKITILKNSKALPSTTTLYASVGADGVMITDAGQVVYNSSSQRWELTLPMAVYNSNSFYYAIYFYPDSTYTGYLGMAYLYPKAKSIGQNVGQHVSSGDVWGYSEAKANKVTSISVSSTDTEYPSALAVKTYVDNNGFNPSSMETVTETPSLLQVQADWNQSNASAADYIKNKPTIPEVNDVWELVYLGDSWNGTYTWVYFDIRKNGVLQTSGNLSIDIRGLYLDSGNALSAQLAEFQYSSLGGKWMGRYTGKFSANMARIRYTLNLNDTGVTSTLVYKKADSIAANENGYVTGDQVNTVVGNIETLLAQI